jgi:hypothetical protein
VAAADLNLSGADLEEIDRIMADSVPLSGPSPEMMTGWARRATRSRISGDERRIEPPELRSYMPLLLHTRCRRRRGLSGDAPVDQSFMLQRVQPALSGLMDGSLSTLAPIFAVVLATHEPVTAFFTGLATALGAGVSMASPKGCRTPAIWPEGANPFVRGAITGGGTFLGGVFHTLPFLITD